MGRPSGRSTTPLETQEVLFVAEDAECSKGTKPGKLYDTGTSEETHQRTRGAEIVRQQHWRRKIWCWRSKFGNWWNTSNCWWSLRKSVECKIGKEFCGIADAQKKNTMSTMSSDEMAWTDEQARLSPKVPPWSVLAMSARNSDESGWDFSLVRFVLSDTFWCRMITNQAFQKRHRRLWNTSCRTLSAHGFRA